MNVSDFFKSSAKKSDDPFGSLTLVVGPMFSSKSTYLLSKIRKFNVIERSCLIVSWKGDTRSDRHLKTHDNEKITSSINVTHLSELLEKENELQNHEEIVIDEGHFFSDLSDVVLKLLFKYKKNVIVGSLFMDYNNDPFEEIMKLMPFANNVKFKYALCKSCKNGTKASHTKKTNLTHKDRIEVGDSELYTPVCTYHYFNHD